MASQPTPVLKISEYHAAPGDTVVTDDTLLPLKNHLYLVAVCSDTAAPSVSVSGCGLTWVQEDTIAGATSSSGKQIHLFRGLSTTSTGLVEEALTISLGGQDQANVSVQVVDVNFADTSGSSGSGALVQSVADNTAVAVTLAAFGDATNNLLLGFIFSVDIASVPQGITDIVPEASNSYHELDQIAGSAANNTSPAVYSPAQSAIIYRTGEDTSFTCSSVTSSGTTPLTIGIVCEIKMRSGTAMLLELEQAEETDEAAAATVYVVGSASASADSLGETTRGGLVRRVGESLGLAYDVAGYEQTFLRFLWDKAIKEVLLKTHCYIQIADLDFTSGTSEYRLPSSILAIDDGRGSTPSGIGHYQVIGLDEMISRQSANPVSDSYRKFIALAGHNLLIVSPTPSTSETIRFFYVPVPTASTADTNDFTSAIYGGLPAWASEAVEYYMLWKASEYDDKFSPLKPTDYMNLFEAKCAEVRQQTRRMRDRRDPIGRIGYPSKRFAVPAKNSQYPR